MKMQNTKKLTGTLLACVVMLGGAIGAYAAEPTNETESAVVTKAIALTPSVAAEKGEGKQKLQLTRIDGESVEAVEISVVPLTSIVSTTEAAAGNVQVSMKATPLMPAKVVPMEKIVIE